MTGTKLITVSSYPLLETLFGFLASRCISVAVELELFDKLEDGPLGLEELARRSDCSWRGLSALTQSLVTLGVLGKKGEQLSLNDLSATYLLRTSPNYVGQLIRVLDGQWTRWTNLKEAVQRGAPIADEEEDEQSLADFVEGLHNLNRPAAEATAAFYAANQILNVADVGCGSAVWSVPWARRGAHVVAIDREAVLNNVTKKFVRNAKLEHHYQYRSGNLTEVELEEEAYDVIILGHVLHAEGRQRSLQLLRRCHKALRPGGRVIVAEMVPDDGKSQDVYGVLFGIQMLMMTPEGEIFSAPELEEMLRQAGFNGHDWLVVPFPYPILSGRKG